MNLPIPIFRNEINALGDFKGGVKVARDFALYRRNPENRGLLGVFRIRRRA